MLILSSLLGNGYYLFSTTNLKCNLAEKGNFTITDEAEEEKSEESFKDPVGDVFLLTYW